MAILVFAAFLFGVVLAPCFRWPASFLVMMLILACSINGDQHGFLASFIRFGVLSLSLQTGYVFGLIILFCFKPSDLSGRSTPDTGISPRNDDPRETFKRRTVGIRR